MTPVAIKLAAQLNIKLPHNFFRKYCNMPSRSHIIAIITSHYLIHHPNKTVTIYSKGGLDGDMTKEAIKEILILNQPLNVISIIGRS
jgi:hypothetical protein